MKSLIISTLILLLATFFSTLSLGNARRFHPDEAFYMTFSRNAAVNGDWWMISEPVDKPPLTFYTNALSLVFLAVETDDNGVLQLDPLKGEFAGRVPSVLMSVILVAVVMALAKSLPLPLAPSPHSREGEQNITDAIHHVPTNTNWMVYIVGLLAALSPFRIVFAATAFTDLPMLLFATISLWMAARGKWFWAGFWFIVSFWAKPQSVFYLPLLVGLLIYQMYKTDAMHHVPTNQNVAAVGTAWMLSARKKQLLNFILPIILGALLLWSWDMVRMGQGAESFFVLGQSRYTATMITPFADYPARLAEWWTIAQYLFGNGILTLIFLAIGIIGTIRRKNAISLILIGWILAFSLAHIALTLNLFDRNQIVLLPVIVLIIGLGITDMIHHVPTIYRDSVGTAWMLSAFKKLSTFSLLLCVSVFSFLASFHQLPIGGDDGRHDGINELADYLNSKPIATVIYDPWLDWELDYYMGVWTDKRRVFYPTPELLIRDALALEEVGNRYFVVPVEVDESLWLDALGQAEFSLSLDYETSKFRVWQLSPP